MKLTKAKQRAAVSACNEAAAELIREILDAPDWSLEDFSGKLQGLERIEQMLTLASSAARIYRVSRARERRAALAGIIKEALLAVGIQRSMSRVDVMIHLEGHAEDDG